MYYIVLQARLTVNSQISRILAGKYYGKIKN